MLLESSKCRFPPGLIGGPSAARDMKATQIESAEMRQALQERCGPDGFLALPDFVETALYHPALGYYRQERSRVGRSPQADFYTATSLREAFAQAAVEAACGLLEQAGLDARETDWVEIGAEPKAALLEGAAHPFRGARSIGAGEPVEIAGQCVVFSNELFDAQPFRQVRFIDDAWVEFGLTLRGDAVSWTEAPSPAPETARYLKRLPRKAFPGYTVDLPTGADALLRGIAEQDWTGAFIAFDYGKSWAGLVGETPQGTARGYCRHAQDPDFLARAGQQDITHHVCWDFLEAILAESGFSSIALESQESFVARRAPKLMAEAFSPSRGALDPLRSQLRQLIHPSLMGQKFQALSALRAPG